MENDETKVGKNLETLDLPIETSSKSLLSCNTKGQGTFSSTGLHTDSRRRNTNTTTEISTQAWETPVRASKTASRLNPARGAPGDSAKTIVQTESPLSSSKRRNEESAFTGSFSKSSQWRRTGLSVNTGTERIAPHKAQYHHLQKSEQGTAGRDMTGLSPLLKTGSAPRARNASGGTQRGGPGSSSTARKGEKRPGSEIKYRGAWTPDEDERLIAIVKTRGPCGWTAIAAELDTGRNGRQCRERWSNQINPDLVRSNWSEEEDSLILKLHAEVGNKWATIAKHLPGRTDNMVKNRFNGSLLPRTSKGDRRGSSSKKRGTKTRTEGPNSRELPKQPKHTETVQDEILLQTPRSTSGGKRRRSTGPKRQSKRIASRLSPMSTGGDSLLDSARAAATELFDFSPEVLRRRSPHSRMGRRSDSVSSTGSLSQMLKRDPFSPFSNLKFSPAHYAEAAAMLETPRGGQEELLFPGKRDPLTPLRNIANEPELTSVGRPPSTRRRTDLETGNSTLRVETPTNSSVSASFGLKTPTPSFDKISAKLNFEPLGATDDFSGILSSNTGTPSVTPSHAPMSPSLKYLVQHYQDILESQKKRPSPEACTSSFSKQGQDMNLASHGELQALLRDNISSPRLDPVPRQSTEPASSQDVRQQEQQRQRQHSIMSSSLLLQKLLTPRNGFSSTAIGVAAGEEQAQDNIEEEIGVGDDATPCGPTPCKSSSSSKKRGKRVSPATKSKGSSLDPSKEHWGLSKNPCKCKRSKCLKLYCTCFSSSLHCGPGCQCLDCCNSADNEMWSQTLTMPNRSSPNKSGVTSCKCKNSMCLKKYCDCFRSGVRCGASCECADCKNTSNEALVGSIASSAPEAKLVLPVVGKVVAVSR